MVEVVGTHPSNRLGRYEVIKHLASGGMAEVLLARAAGIEGFERYVVIKRIHIERARDPYVVKMFCDEARLAGSMHHHNIVQVHDIGQEKGEYFFAMEYVHGEDLRRILTTVNRAGGTIPTEHVITIVTAAASALHYAHEHKSSNGTPYNIVHRDVSPANILVGYDGEVKVVDFGIAKASFRSAETQSGTLKGKISYMAPEQCLGAAVDRRSDVFALGIVLFELFTVRRLFKGSSDFLTMSAIVAGNTPKPSTFRPDTPPEIEAIIMKALAHKAEDRYQTANELRLALEAYGKAAGLRSSTASLGEYMTALLGRRPEPWLEENREIELAVAEVDFDGPAHNTPNSSRVASTMPTPPPGSLFARVRRKMAPAGGIEVTPMPPPPHPGVGAEVPTEIASALPPPPGGWDADDKAPTTASGTPMAGSPGTPIGSAAVAAAAVVPKRRGLAIAAVGTLVLVGILTFRLIAGGDEPAQDAAAPATASGPVAVPPIAAPSVPESIAAPPVEEPIAAPPVPVPEHDLAGPSAAAGAGALTAAVVSKRVAIKKFTAKTAPAKTRSDKPRYDPKSLFPK